MPEPNLEHQELVSDLTVCLRQVLGRDVQTKISPGVNISHRAEGRELLLIDRAPWFFDLHRSRNGELALVGRSTSEDPRELERQVLPIRLQLVSGAQRPRTDIVATSNDDRWMI